MIADALGKVAREYIDQALAERQVLQKHVLESEGRLAERLEMLVDRVEMLEELAEIRADALRHVDRRGQRVLIKAL